MKLTNSDVLLWGHSLEDYKKMFLLDAKDLNGKILDCCSGPASFNAELTAQGGQVISCDTLYALPLDKMKQKINETFAQMLVIVKRFKDRFVWQSPDELAEIRSCNIEIFLRDFPKGQEQHRYQFCELPQLEYKHFQFDLAVCPHFLFSNSSDQSMEFHLNSIIKLCDVAKELRIFPILNSKNEIPSLVGPVMQALQAKNYGLEFKAVPYEFQKKGNAMLRVWAQVCEV